MTFKDWSITHDFAFQFGGAERVTATLSHMLPTAPVHILGGHPDTIRRMALSGPVSVYFRHGLGARTYRALAPAYPLIQRLAKPLEGNVVASSYGYAHLRRVTGRLIYYCHSPLRQAWSGLREYSHHAGAVTGRLWRHGGAPVHRFVDRRALASADVVIANSSAVARRLRSYFGIAADVIYPPVDEAFSEAGRTTTERADTYIWAGRVVEPYKKLEVLIEVFRQSPSRSLLVAGDGRDRVRLERNSPANVHFLGEVDTLELSQLYAQSSALIMPSEDDFGLVAAEALATGTPVLALSRGGALDIVRNGENGYFFDEAVPKKIADALSLLERQPIQRSAVLESSLKFTSAAFISSMRKYL